MKNLISRRIASSTLILAASFGLAAGASVVMEAPASAAYVHPGPVVNPVLTPKLHLGLVETGKGAQVAAHVQSFVDSSKVGSVARPTSTPMH